MALRRARQIGAECVQIFVKNNMQWFGKAPSDQDLSLFADELAANRFRCVFGHTGYLINLGAPDSVNREHSIKSLLQELQFGTQLGLPFLVMHPGAHLGNGEPAALKQIVRGLNEVFAATKKSPVRIALENTAGQGTCLGYKISHLASIFVTVHGVNP
jgi:deoxyribonuclease-4